MGFSWGLEFFGAGVNFFLIDKVLRPLNHMSILKYCDFFSTDYGIKYLFCLSNMMFTHYTRFFYQTITKEFPSDTYIMLSGYCGLDYEKNENSL